VAVFFNVDSNPTNHPFEQTVSIVTHAGATSNMGNFKARDWALEWKSGYV
jgi:hypothetical protein